MFKSFITDYIPNDLMLFNLNHEIVSFADIDIFMPKMDLLSGFCIPNFSPPDFV
jgi:hypothetical protein